MVSLHRFFAVVLLSGSSFPLLGCRGGGAVEDRGSERPMMEVREVRCTESTDDMAWRYDCRGTLVTRDARFQNADVLVWVENRTKRANEKESAPTLPGYVLMTNGVATLESGAYY